MTARDSVEHNTVLERVDRLCDRLAPHAAAHDRDGSVNHPAVDAIVSSGLLALPTPRAAGGGAASLALAQQVVGRIARIDASTALFLVNHYMVHADISARAGWSDALAARVEEQNVRRPGLINALLAEPDLGSASQGGLPGTIARRTPDGWRLDGRKAYVTGIPVLSWLLVRARTEDTDPRLGLFLVPARDPGVIVHPTWDHIGMRSSASHEVELRDVRVAAEDTSVLTVAGPASADQGKVMLHWNIGLLGALYDGVVRAACDWTIRFLREREPSSLGRPLATLPVMQDEVGDVCLTLDRNALLLDMFARAVDDADTETVARGSAIIKSTVIDGAATVTQQLMGLAGNAGLSARNSLERCHRDALCGRIHAPHAELLRRKAGQKALLS